MERVCLGAGLPWSAISLFGKFNDDININFNINIQIDDDSNNIKAVKEAVKKGDIASVIIEPIAGNMNFIRSEKNFLQELRSICTNNKIVLIFDEVMTGFRVCKAGAQKLYNIDPDITTLGKVLGGGLPVGAFGGKKEIMNHIAPMGGVYQAGTLSGNPLAMAAGLKTLEIISEKNFFDMLSKKASQLVAGINKVSKKYNLNVTADSEGGMFGIYFTKSRLKNMNDINLSSKDDFLDFFNFVFL